MMKIKRGRWKTFAVAVVVAATGTALGGLFLKVIDWTGDPTVGVWIKERVTASSSTESPDGHVIDPVNSEGGTSNDDGAKNPTPTATSLHPSITPPSSSSSKTVFLSKLTPVDKVSQIPWEFDKSYSLDGKQFNNSIYARCYVSKCRDSPDSVEYDLGKNYKRLTATVGIYQRAKDSDQPAVLTVYLDDEKYGDSYTLTGGNGESQEIEIPVENVLRIRIELAGTDINYNEYDVKAFEVVIGDPILHKD
ncbi:NPCBM/NEW2 domain-containing protein [Actinomyces capricornis]|uniref:Glycosyl hydrolase family 98 putative carbohydrate-binding module domain-containing protein n=1 Tax=Actinomyces capricornis TaxID=2755559 RepID=A0ABM7UEZ8_9ACTO|nr:NPCBM/NEW2 domain-containing protein [Actinomyces capricornis]BDA65726.1 hypothetical protein MANAM107_25600 [Actinomyces capricornis]